MQPKGYAEKRRQFLTSINEAIDCLDEAAEKFGTSYESTVAALDNAVYAVDRARDVIVVTRIS